MSHVARSASRSYLWAAAMLVAMPSVMFAGPITFVTKMPDASGIQRDIAFNGQIDAGKVSGTVTVEGNDLPLAATVNADGVISGYITLPDGRFLGSFAGQLGGPSGMAIDYNIAGIVGRSNVPSEVAAAVKDASAAKAVAK
jgi:hypothetical protein